MPKTLKQFINEAKDEPKFPDTKQGCIDCFHYNADKQYHGDPKTYKVTPDPSVEGVWLLSHPAKKQSFIVYTKDNDFEDTDYDKSQKYHR